MSYPANSDSVAQDQIKAFVDRIIRLREEGRAIKGDEKEVYAEAKGNGYDKTALGKLVLHVERHSDSKTAAKAVEQDALLELYLEAYYGPSHTHAHAREADTSSTAARMDVPATADHSAMATGWPDHGSNLQPGTEAGTQAPPVETIPGNNAEAAENEVEVALVASSSANSWSENDGVSLGEKIQSTAVDAPTAQMQIVAAEVSVSLIGDKDRAPSADRSEGIESGRLITNIVPIRTHNPETHFLNSKGLLRLHGCNKPEACAGSFKALCFGCEQTDGAVA